MEFAPCAALIALALAPLVTKVSRSALATILCLVAMYVVDGCLSVIVPTATEFDADVATSEAASRGISCVAVYGRDQIDSDANSFNPFDHVRALADVESIFRRL